MTKRGLKTLILISVVIIISLLFVSSFFVKAQYETNMTKGFMWLENRTADKGWPKTLTTDQFVFSLLALEERLNEGSVQAAITNLTEKSFKGKCWPRPEDNCKSKETALAKLMLNAAGESTEDADEWLLNSTIEYKEIDWYLQITPEYSRTSLECALIYGDQQQNQYAIKISEDEKIEGEPGPYFVKEDNKYRLKLEQKYSDKAINITCNNKTIINFLYKEKDNWYVTTPNYKENGVWQVGGDILRIENIMDVKTIRPIQVFCSTTSPDILECDYEASLWTAFAFAQAESGKTGKIRGIVPYLILEKENYEQFLPAAFLFSITSSSQWLSELKTRQSPTNNLWLAPNSVYNKFHDTALAGIMTGGKAGDWPAAEKALFKKQSKKGNWIASTKPNPIKDTALILLALQTVPEELVECIIEGYDCVGIGRCEALDSISQDYECPEGFECCDIDYGPNECKVKGGACKLSCAENEQEIDYNCPEAGKICCITSNLVTCAQLEGQKCTTGQKCVNENGFIIPLVRTKDNDCCLGECVTPTKTCTDLNGTICNGTGYSCDDKWLPAIDTEICCKIGFCKKELKKCSDMGGELCEDIQICKDGAFVVAKDTAGKETCCVSGGRCVFENCKAAGGESCAADEVCDGTEVEAIDVEKCCLDDCVIECSSVGEPCPYNYKCKRPINGTDNPYCCERNQCIKKRKKGFPFWLLILIIIALALVIFMFMRKRKKKKPPRMMIPGMPPTRRPPRRGVFARRPPARLPARPGVPPVPAPPRPPGKPAAVMPAKPMPAVKPAFPVKPPTKAKPKAKLPAKPKPKAKRKAVLEELEKITKE